MATYRTLENKIRDIVARPWTKDPKQVHHKQQQIQKKIIDEAPDMLSNKNLGIPDSVIEAAKTINKKTTEVEIDPEYKTKVDQEEELVGKQHKIDTNKNGKIDADDFKKLRSKTLKEAPPTSSDPDFGAPRHPSSPSNPGEIKFKPEPKKPEQKKPVPPLPPKRPSTTEEAKPDYLDFDKDGNEKESMKKALKDKKKVTKEEVVFSDEEIARLEDISKGMNEALPLAAIAGALRNFGSSAMKQLPKPQSFPQIPSPDKFQKPMDMLNRSLSGDAIKSMRDRATGFIDKIKGNGAKNNALLGLQGVHDVSALATGKDPYTQAMKEPQAEVPQATAPDTPESPKAAPTEKKKINAKEETLFSDEEIARLEDISNDIEESKKEIIKKGIEGIGAGVNYVKNLVKGGAKKADDVTPPASSAQKQLPAPATPKQLSPPKAEPAAPSATKAPDKTFGPKDMDIIPPAPRAAPASQKASSTGPSTTFKEPAASPKLQPMKFSTSVGKPPALYTRPKTTKLKNKLPAVSKPVPKTKTREIDKTFGPDDIEIIPPAPKNKVPATPDSLKKPGVTIDVPPNPSTTLKTPKTVTPNPLSRAKTLSRTPDTMPQDLEQPKTDTALGRKTDTATDKDTSLSQKTDTATTTNTPTDTPTSIPPRIPPRPPITPIPPIAPMPIPITPPVMKPQAQCKTCGPNIAIRTYGRVEPRVGAPSPTQVQNSYEPTGNEIREANLAAQIRDAKPSLTGHIEVSVGDKRVKIPHRKAQDFLGSYHSKRTPAEKDAHEKAFRREIGG